MRHALSLAAFLLLSSTASVIAASLTVNFTNQSGDTINEIAAIPKEPPAPPPQDVSESTQVPNEGNLESSGPPAESNLEVSEPPVQNILAAPIAAGDSGAVTIEAADGECVFKLAFTFASGKVLERPDTDICQTDSIIIE